MQAVDTDRVRVGDTGWRVECANCGKHFDSIRCDASFCSARCRKYYSREPHRRQAALDELEAIARRVNAIAHDHSRSQTFLDATLKLYKQIGLTLDVYEVEWKPTKLPLMTDDEYQKRVDALYSVDPVQYD